MNPKIEYATMSGFQPVNFFNESNPPNRPPITHVPPTSFLSGKEVMSQILNSNFNFEFEATAATLEFSSEVG